MMSTMRCNEWRGEPFFSLSLSLICLLRKMIHCELSLSNFDLWSRGKEDKDNVVLYFDSWPRQEQCITLPLKQVNPGILRHCHQHLPPRVVFSLKGTIINFDFESTLADFQLLLQGHDHQRGQACRCVSLRLLQHRRQVGNNSQSYIQSVPKNETQRFGFDSCLSSLIVMLKCVFNSNVNINKTGVFGRSWCPEKSQFWIDSILYFFVHSSRGEALDLESAMVTSNL